MFNRIKSPCKHCPFRTDIRAYLNQSRAEDIASALLAGKTFACHETTIESPESYSEDDSCGSDGSNNTSGDLVIGPDSQHCAGAAILLEKIKQPNQMMQVCGRLGLYDPGLLDMEAPVFDSFGEFVSAQPELR